MASRRIEDLHPDLQPLAVRFVERCAERLVDVLITCTWRSDEEQDALYTIGRTVPGRRVTNARGGQSKHNGTRFENGVGWVREARAFDAVPLLHGKPIWEDPRDADTDWTNDFGWRVMGEVAEEVGLVWYGRPGAKSREAPHFQLPG
jgi:peptidoglycan L-alanyl-D-glutamate endopeptidase CwlK